MTIFLDALCLEADMIVADATEVRGGSKVKLGNVDVKIANDLEELTGADFMISPLEMPFTAHLLGKHLRAGAILIQRKHRTDLVSSLGDRLHHSLARMQQTGARREQCVLLFIGTLTCNREGMAMIDGKEALRPYWAVYAGLTKWSDRGGTVYPPLARATLLPGFLEMKQRHVIEFHRCPTYRFFPPSPELLEPKPPLQVLEPVTDWRRIAVGFKGWGVKRITDLRKIMLASNASDNLMTALVWMTRKDLATKISGVGNGLVQRTRDQLGLDDGFQIVLKVDEEVKTDGKSKSSKG